MAPWAPRRAAGPVGWGLGEHPGVWVSVRGPHGWWLWARICVPSCGRDVIRGHSLTSVSVQVHRKQLCGALAHSRTRALTDAVTRPRPSGTWLRGTAVGCPAGPSRIQGLGGRRQSGCGMWLLWGSAILCPQSSSCWVPRGSQWAAGTRTMTGSCCHCWTASSPATCCTAWTPGTPRASNGSSLPGRLIIPP